jgi:hypothetical protein
MRDTCERGDARADRNKCIWDRVRPLTARGPMRVLRNVSRFLILVHEATGAVRGNDTADAISGGNKVKPRARSRVRDPDTYVARARSLSLTPSLALSLALSLSFVLSLAVSCARSLAVKCWGPSAQRLCYPTFPS